MVLTLTVQKNHVGPSLDVLKSGSQLRGAGGADVVRLGGSCRELHDSSSAAFFRFSRNEGPQCHHTVCLHLGLSGNSSVHSRLPGWAWWAWVAARCSSLPLDWVAPAPSEGRASTSGREVTEESSALV